MEVIDKILNEWSFRCHDGIVDMNDPKKAKILLEILKPILTEDIDDDILNALVNADSDTKSQVLKFIKKSTSKTSEKTDDDGFYSYLKNKNITNDMIDGMDVPERIHDVLIDNDDFEDFNEYRRDANSFPGGFGSLSNVLANTQISSKSLSEIINIDGKKKGVGVGKGEVALALFFSDIKKSPGKGDLEWNGDNLEVKSKGARLGGDREVSSSVILGSNLGKTAEKYDFNPLKRLDAIISGLHDEIDPKELYNITMDFLKNIYPNADFKYFTPESLNNISDTRKALNKLYISNYMNSENIQHLIYIDTAGNYITFSPDQIDEIVDKKILKINSISGTNLYPQIG